MIKTKKHPLIPAKAGIQNLKRWIKPLWIPAFAGMSGMVLLACSPAEETAVQADTQMIKRVETPAAPSTPKPKTLEDVDFTAYSQDLAKFIGFERGESWISAVDKVRLYFAPEAGSQIVKTSTQRFDRPDGAVMIMSVDNLADDSVRALEVFLILTGPQGKQTLAEYGMRQKCWRGDNATNWQTELCP